MKYVTPKVFMLAKTTLTNDSVKDWLEHLGVRNWTSAATSHAEALIEMAGRRCYRAFETEEVSVSEQNPNLSRVRESNFDYIENILKSKHGSVLEHAGVTFAIEDVSRVFTHEVVRHRLCAFSQESLRFVRPTSLNAFFPSIFSDIEDDYTRKKVENIFETTFVQLEDIQAQLVEVLGMDDVKRKFGDKKLLQSAMRRLMPIGMATGIIVTTNHRNWRWLIEMRTSRHSEEEIRIVFNMIFQDLLADYPAIYSDGTMAEANGHNEITFNYGRV